MSQHSNENQPPIPDDPIPDDLAVELHALALVSLDGSASDEELARLDQIVCENPGAAQYLARCVQTSRHLRDWAGNLNSGKRKSSSHSPVLGFLSNVLPIDSHTPMSSAAVWMMAFLGVIVLGGITAVVMILVNGITVHVDQRQVAIAPAPASPDDSSDDSPDDEQSLPVVARRHVVDPVARLARTVDCVWAGNNPPESGEDLEAGQNLRLQAGLAEIVFTSGAHAILQGPASLEVRGRNSAVLAQGKCSITVEVPAARGFQIDTPGMKFIDMGTEFGVEIAPDSQQQTHVFRGKVVAEVEGINSKSQSPPRPSVARDRMGEGRGEGNANLSATPIPNSSASPSTHNPPSSTLELTAGNALKIAAPGKPIERIAADERQFVRALPPATALDLVDIVAGGDGLSARRNRFINPTNGCFDDKPNGRNGFNMKKGSFKADHKYHRLASASLIDGVFTLQGGAAVQLDSAGHRFAGFPRTAATTIGFLGAVGATAAHPAMFSSHEQPVVSKFGSADYSSIGHGLLYIHNNKGITFDLGAIRTAQPRYGLVTFTAVALNPHPNSGKTFFGDFWVFVDGRLRFSCQKVARSSGETAINVPLQPSDRFLTLATTDGNGRNWNNMSMLGDPKIKLSPVKE